MTDGRTRVFIPVSCYLFFLQMDDFMAWDVSETSTRRATTRDIMSQMSMSDRPTNDVQQHIDIALW